MLIKAVDDDMTETRTRKFDDGEERDADGKWTDGGAGATESEAASEKYFRADEGRLERIRDYTNRRYKSINQYLRDPGLLSARPELIPAVRADAQALLKDLNNAPKSPGEVHRGVILPGEVLAKLTPGATYRARTFLSSSSSEKQGQLFADAYNDRLAGWGRNEEKLTRAMLHITQTTGVSIAGASRLLKEREVLLRPGTRFKVDRVSIKPNEAGDAVTHVYMTESRTKKAVEDEARDADGKWTAGGGSTAAKPPAKPEGEHSGIRPASVKEFKGAFDKAFEGSPFSAFVTHYSEEQLGGMKMFLSEDGKAGQAVHDHGDGRIEATALFNQGAPKGTGRKLLLHVVAHAGVNYLECYGEGLRKLYESAGFKVASKSPFNPEYAAPGWDYDKLDHPDYFTMRNDGK